VRASARVSSIVIMFSWGLVIIIILILLPTLHSKLSKLLLANCRNILGLIKIYLVFVLKLLIITQPVSKSKVNCVLTVSSDRRRDSDCHLRITGSPTKRSLGASLERLPRSSLRVGIRRNALHFRLVRRFFLSVL